MIWTLSYFRLITCNRITKREFSLVMMSCFQRLRFPWRGGAFPLTHEMLAAAILQPVLALTLSMFSYKVIIMLIFFILNALVLVSFYFAHQNSRSQILYYWTVSSVTYSIIILENSVVSLSEITFWENFVIVVLAIGSIYYFYLVKTHSTHNPSLENPNGELLGNGAANDSICPVCGIKVYPRNCHCHICQSCIPKYDFHCFWLNCCVGETNQHYFVVGLLFGLSAFLYGSLLILTTICRPEFRFGILVPEDCSAVTDDTEYVVPSIYY